MSTASGHATGGDEETPFDAWVRDHVPILTALAAREVGTADAYDIVQETLIRAWQRRETYSPARGSARGWLIGILWDRIRRHRSRSRTDAPPTPAPASTGVEDRLAVEDAVRRLPLRQRQVVSLFYLADLPVTDIAAVLRISPSTVKTTLRDARHHLRTDLEDH